MGKPTHVEDLAENVGVVAQEEISRDCGMWLGSRLRHGRGAGSGGQGLWHCLVM